MTANFVAETGIDLSFIIVLFESVDGGVTRADEAYAYHQVIGTPNIAVLGDVYAQALGITPYNGSALPGKCALTPDMEILGCIASEDSTPVLEMIQQHAASR